jgi:hypothetical protein
MGDDDLGFAGVGFMAYRPKAKPALRRLLMTRAKVIALCNIGARHIRDTLRGLEDTRRI